MDTDFNIGIIIKKFRLEKNMTIKALAEQTQITSSMLSQIEHGLANPSLNTIRAIAQTLDTPLFKFFMESEPDVQKTFIIKPKDRKHLIANGVEYELLTPDRDTSIEFMLLTLVPGGSTINRPTSHKGEEVALVTIGKVEIIIDDTCYLMENGDSMHIPAMVKHCWHNPFEENAQVVFAVTPPEF